MENKNSNIMTNYTKQPQKRNSIITTFVETITRFLHDLRKYWEYILFAAKSALRNEVAGSYLSWLWWVLDPILFMLVYTFVVQFVFRSGQENFPVFVFIGLNVWQFFNSSMMSSVSIIRSYRAIISRVYVPKYVFILVTMIRNLIKMGISFLLVYALLIIFNIKFTYHNIYIIPITIVLFMVTFSFSLIVAHIGAFVTDFSNVLTAGMRLLFYVSGVLYSVSDRIPEPYRTIMYHIDPPAVLIEQYRNVMMYQTPPDYYYLGYWAVVSIIVGIIGLNVIYKYENTYVKVV